MIFFCFTIGDQCFVWKLDLTKRYLKTKFVLVICVIKGNFWDPKNVWIIIDFFFQKLVWFGMFWMQVPKIEWSISFYHWTQIYYQKLKILKKKNFLKFFTTLQIWHQGDFLSLYLIITFFYFNSKFVSGDENWVEIILHMSTLGTCTQNIPNQTRFCEKNP